MPAAATERLHALDAIRGVAALLVVVHHLHSALPDAARPDLLGGPLRAIQLGRPMVILFLVLSGFILTVSLRRRPEGLAAFAVRRAFRIYLPFLAAVGMAATLVAILRPVPIPQLSGWFNAFWVAPLTPGMLGCHVAMVGSGRCNSLVNPMWSLVVEMRWSLLFPLLVAAVLLVRPAVAVAATALLTFALARFWGLGQPYTNQSLAQILPFTAYFGAFFVAGIALALRREDLGPRLAGLPWPVRAGLWAAALALLSAGDDLVNAAGAALLIALALETPEARAALGGRVPQWLGRVSYSLYLPT